MNRTLDQIAQRELRDNRQFEVHLCGQGFEEGDEIRHLPLIKP